jgi:hypothetical protein
MDLVSNYSDVMVPFLGECIDNLQGTSLYAWLMIDPEMMTPEKTLLREAIYNAITLNALALYDLIDFDAWLVTGVTAELANIEPQYLKSLIRLTLVPKLCVDEWRFSSANGSAQNAHSRLEQGSMKPFLACLPRWIQGMM